MRIVHCANYHFKKDGAEFDNWDLKLDQGLSQNGWYVFPFSVNDRARMLSPTRHKTFGIARANKALIRTCANIAPDLLLLGHAQRVTRNTLLRIRDMLPDIKIALWYCDTVTSSEYTDHLYKRMDALDALFFSTGGTMIEPFSGNNRLSAFVPNPVESNVECSRAFECESPEYDMVFFGRDDPRRNPVLETLRNKLTDCRFGFFGCLGTPGVYGHQREVILARSAMALNLSRYNDVELYSSDRLADVIGNGLLTFCYASSGMQALYPENEIVYFDDEDELAQLVLQYKTNDADRRSMAQRAWKHAHSDHSAQRVAQFMVEATFRQKGFDSAPWPMHVFGD